jgi:hypothetical protein
MEPVKTNRPMSEYESALLWALVAIGQSLLEAGSLSETSLLTKLSEHRSEAASVGRTNEAATYEILIKFLGEPPTYFVPGPNFPTGSN